MHYYHFRYRSPLSITNLMSNKNTNYFCNCIFFDMYSGVEFDHSIYIITRFCVRIDWIKCISSITIDLLPVWSTKGDFLCEFWKSWEQLNSSNVKCITRSHCTKKRNKSTENICTKTFCARCVNNNKKKLPLGFYQISITFRLVWNRQAMDITF